MSTVTVVTSAGAVPGHLAIPDGDGPWPAVVVIHEIFGLNDDIRAIAKPVLRHRLVTSFTAESEGIRPDAIIDRIIEALPETD